MSCGCGCSACFPPIIQMRSVPLDHNQSRSSPRKRIFFLIDVFSNIIAQMRYSSYYIVAQMRSCLCPILSLRCVYSSNIIAHMDTPPISSLRCAHVFLQYYRSNAYTPPILSSLKRAYGYSSNIIAQTRSPISNIIAQTRIYASIYDILAQTRSLWMSVQKRETISAQPNQSSG